MTKKIPYVLSSPYILSNTCTIFKVKLPRDYPTALSGFPRQMTPSQLDVLAHPNVRVFFNHAGANSFHEGIHFGKPLLMRPLWFDCDDIAVRAADSGIGLVVDPTETIDPDDVVSNLTRPLTEDSFRERAEHRAERQHATSGVRTAADPRLLSREVIPRHRFA
ncbi:MAG: hypothetical protein ACRDP6_07485 [Actinoallomurus sp.]